MNHAGRLWVIVLAGGSGERLSSVTTSLEGGMVPKQFCRLGGRDSMLDVTLARARSLTTANRIVVVVRGEHRRWWEDELAGVWSNNVLVHSRNRGTGVALLDGLLHVSAIDPAACFVVLPSDHVVDDERILTDTIREAVDEAKRSPGNVVVLGAPDEVPDPSLGWVVPGGENGGRIRPVTEFVEKPSLARAAECLRRGALRNTLILTGSARAFLKLYGRGVPEPRASFVSVNGFGPGSDEALRVRVNALRAIYPHFPAMDLGRDILQPSARWLRVLPLPECGWTDIGTPERLETWWRGHPKAWNHVRESGVLPPALEGEVAGGGRGIHRARRMSRSKPGRSEQVHP